MATNNDVDIAVKAAKEAFEGGGWSRRDESPPDESPRPWSSDVQIGGPNGRTQGRIGDP